MNQRERNALDRHITGNYGEDQFRDEPDFDEEPESQEPRAWQTYDLVTREDGVIEGWCNTNDNNDDGYPDFEDARWTVHYRNHAEMLKRTGGSHIGCSGVEVTVYLDGVEVPPPDAEPEDEQARRTR